MDFLFKKIDNRHLAWIRIVVGSWFFIDVVSMLLSGYVKEAYVEPEFNFPFYGFEWIEPLPGIGMYILFIFLAIVSVGITLGYRFKTCLVLFIIGFGYVFMCDITYTLNKFYLFLILASMMLLTKADGSISFSTQKTETSPYWQLLSFKLLFGLIYFYSGVSKINPDWLLHAEPLRFFLRNAFAFKWMSKEIFIYSAYGFTYCGFIFDLSIFFLLTNRKTLVIAHILQTTFHLLNFTLLGIGSLSIFSILLTHLLFPLPWLKRKLKISEKEGHYATTYIFPAMAATTLFIIFMIPHRHYLIENNVNWTEKGHRFSWRLMTRTKRGSSSFFIVKSDQLTTPKRIKPLEILTRRQYRKMSAETDLIIAFAHYLQDKHAQEGHTNIEVRANVRTKLNGRKKGLLVDPDLDLTQVSRSILSDNISQPIPERKKAK